MKKIQTNIILLYKIRTYLHMLLSKKAAQLSHVNESLYLFYYGVNNSNV